MSEGLSPLDLKQILLWLHSLSLEQSADDDTSLRWEVFKYLDTSDPLIAYAARRVIVDRIMRQADSSPWLEAGFRWVLKASVSGAAEWVELLCQVMKHSRIKSHPERLSGVNAPSKLPGEANGGGGRSSDAPSAAGVSLGCFPHLSSLWGRLNLSSPNKAAGPGPDVYDAQTDRFVLALLSLTGSCVKLLVDTNTLISLHATSLSSGDGPSLRSTEQTDGGHVNDPHSSSDSENSDDDDDEKQAVCLSFPPLDLFLGEKSQFSAEIQLKSMNLLLVLLRRPECLSEQTFLVSEETGDVSYDSLGVLVLTLIGSEVVKALEHFARSQNLLSLLASTPASSFSSSSPLDLSNHACVNTCLPATSVVSFVDDSGLPLETARAAVLLWTKTLHYTVFAVLEGDNEQEDSESESDEESSACGANERKRDSDMRDRHLAPRAATLKQLLNGNIAGLLAHLIVELLSDDDQALVQGLCDLTTVHATLLRHFDPLNRSSVATTSEATAAAAAAAPTTAVNASTKYAFQHLSFAVGGRAEAIALLRLFLGEHFQDSADSFEDENFPSQEDDESGVPSPEKRQKYPTQSTQSGSVRTITAAAAAAAAEESSVLGGPATINCPPQLLPPLHPFRLFCEFSAALCFDERVILDMLLSNETVALEYLLRILKLSGTPTSGASSGSRGGSSAQSAHQPRLFPRNSTEELSTRATSEGELPTSSDMKGGTDEASIEVKTTEMLRRLRGAVARAEAHGLFLYSPRALLRRFDAHLGRPP